MRTSLSASSLPTLPQAVCRPRAHASRLLVGCAPARPLETEACLAQVAQQLPAGDDARQAGERMAARRRADVSKDPGPDFNTFLVGVKARSYEATA